ATEDLRSKRAIENSNKPRQLERARKGNQSTSASQPLPVSALPFVTTSHPRRTSSNQSAPTSNMHRATSHTISKRCQV
ncbi:conserved hypothetical protein, partial [Ricinus communis]